jgi:hypothetical protein
MMPRRCDPQVDASVSFSTSAEPIDQPFGGKIR